MKKIYIVLTYTGTVLSNIIKLYTGNEFSHISLSLDKELKEMYSFGRINPYIPFIGGFVHEHLEKGTFKRFKSTYTAVYSIKIPNYCYKKLVDDIKLMKENKSLYKYNFIGLLGFMVKKKIRRKNCFYCAEFVKYLLEKSGMDVDLPMLIKPEDFKKINGMFLEYEGILREYSNDFF